MAELKTLQAERKAAVAEAEEKARLLVQLAEYEAQHGRNYDPAIDFPPESQPLGFVFSRPAVLRRLESDKRLKHARELNWNGYLRSDEEESEDQSVAREPRPERPAAFPAIRLRRVYKER
jgi:hypothetical protein